MKTTQIVTTDSVSLDYCNDPKALFIIIIDNVFIYSIYLFVFIAFIYNVFPIYNVAQQHYQKVNYGYVELSSLVCLSSLSTATGSL